MWHICVFLSFSSFVIDSNPPHLLWAHICSCVCVCVCAWGICGWCLFEWVSSCLKFQTFSKIELFASSMTGPFMVAVFHQILPWKWALHTFEWHFQLSALTYSMGPISTEKLSQTIWFEFAFANWTHQANQQKKSIISKCHSNFRLDVRKMSTPSATN